MPSSSTAGNGGGFQGSATEEGQRETEGRQERHSKGRGVTAGQQSINTASTGGNRSSAKGSRASPRHQPMCSGSRSDRAAAPADRQRTGCGPGGIAGGSCSERPGTAGGPGSDRSEQGDLRRRKETEGNRRKPLLTVDASVRVPPFPTALLPCSGLSRAVGKRHHRQRNR